MSSTGQWIQAQKDSAERIAQSTEFLAGEIGAFKETFAREMEELRKSNSELAESQSQLTIAIIAVAVLQIMVSM